VSNPHLRNHPFALQRSRPLNLSLCFRRGGKTFVYQTTRWVATAIPGIVITPEMGIDKKLMDINQFPVLTHFTSGQKIGGPYHSIRQAELVAVALAGFFGNDWTGEVGAIRLWVQKESVRLRVLGWFDDIRKDQHINEYSMASELDADEYDAEHRRNERRNGR
jgi:hypothetical protein